MKKIIDSNHMNELAKTKKKAGIRMHSNCYLFPDQLNRYASQSRLFYDEYDEGLVVFCDMDYYYNLYYFIFPDKGIDFKSPEKTTIVEFHDSKERPNKQNTTMIPYWENYGFKRNATVRRMMCEYDEEMVKNTVYTHPNTHKVSVLRESDYNTVLNMLYTAFDPIKNLFPSKQDILDSMNEGNYICIYDHEDRILGFLETEIEDKYFMGHRLLVNGEIKSKNVALQLKNEMVNRAWDRGVTTRMGWILESNIPAIMSAQKSGLKFDGRYTMQYVLKK